MPQAAPHKPRELQPDNCANPARCTCRVRGRPPCRRLRITCPRNLPPDDMQPLLGSPAEPRTACHAGGCAATTCAACCCWAGVPAAAVASSADRPLRSGIAAADAWGCACGCGNCSGACAWSCGAALPCRPAAGWGRARSHSMMMQDRNGLMRPKMHYFALELSPRCIEHASQMCAIKIG